MELLVVLKYGSDIIGGIQKEDYTGSRGLSGLWHGEAGTRGREFKDMTKKAEQPSLDIWTGG